MKKRIFIALVIATLTIFGCAEIETENVQELERAQTDGYQGWAKTMGGDITMELPPGQKLEEITWKDSDDLWYLTRPFRQGEKAETHVFQQKKGWIGLEGSITIIEREEKK